MRRHVWAETGSRVRAYHGRPRRGWLDPIAVALIGGKSVHPRDRLVIMGALRHTHNQDLASEVRFESIDSNL